MHRKEVITEVGREKILRRNKTEVERKGRIKGEKR